METRSESSERRRRVISSASSQARPLLNIWRRLVLIVGDIAVSGLAASPRVSELVICRISYGEVVGLQLRIRIGYES
jgi:hypothetical protein